MHADDRQEGRVATEACGTNPTTLVATARPHTRHANAKLRDPVIACSSRCLFEVFALVDRYLSSVEIWKAFCTASSKRDLGSWEHSSRVRESAGAAPIIPAATPSVARWAAQPMVLIDDTAFVPITSAEHASSVILALRSKNRTLRSLSGKSTASILGREDDDNRNNSSRRRIGEPQDRVEVKHDTRTVFTIQSIGRTDVFPTPEGPPKAM